VNILFVKKKVWFALLVWCTLGSIAALTGIWGYWYISIGKGMLISNLGPLIQTFYGWLLLGETISRLDMITPFIAIGGVAYLSYFSRDSSERENEYIGALMLLTTAVLSGGIAVYLWKMGKSLHPTYSAFYMGVFMLTLSILLSPTGATHVSSTHLYPFILMLVIGLLSFGHQVTMASAYIKDGVAKVAPIKFSSIIFNYLVDISCFGYVFTLHDTIGSLIIFSAISASVFYGK
jgi:drug/metabolite transporter (DMT)-like permease